MAIAYNISKNNNLYLNIIDNYRCTNSCTFCDREKIEKHLGVNLFLKDSPSFDDVKKVLRSADEFVFCGLGEPTLELELLLKVTGHIKKNFSSIVRVDTNGHGNMIHSRNILPELKEAGVDVLSVSLNATNRDDYDSLHRPVYENAFENVLDFIGKSPIKTIVSFIDFPSLDRDKAVSLAESLGAGTKFRSPIIDCKNTTYKNNDSFYHY